MVKYFLEVVYSKSNVYRALNQMPNIKQHEAATSDFDFESHQLASLHQSWENLQENDVFRRII